jgi:hypothetical protein
MSDEAPDLDRVLPNRDHGIPIERVKQPSARQLAAEDYVVSTWRHLIEEGVMSETGLRTIAATALDVADAFPNDIWAGHRSTEG